MGKIFDVSFMIEIIPKLLRGIPYTLSIAVVAFLVGSVIGFLGALIKIYRVPVLRQLTGIYVSFIRGTPLITQILLIYYGIPIVLRILNEKFGTRFDISGIDAIYFMLIGRAHV